MNDWNGFREWHLLFDALCNHKGFYDDIELAGMLCARTGRGRHEDFEAAKKRLRGWRSGRRLPRRGNLLLLSSILQIELIPELPAHWRTLYEAANTPGRKSAESGQGRWTGGAPSRTTRASFGWMSLTACVLVGLAFAGAVMANQRHVAFMDLPEVGYDAFVRLPLNTTRLIHGEYGRCGGPPPAWEDVVARVPTSAFGSFGDGGLARKMVNDCGREMVVRAVRFTGEAVGMEEITILDDYMKIEVFQRTVQGEGQ